MFGPTAKCLSEVLVFLTLLVLKLAGEKIKLVIILYG